MCDTLYIFMILSALSKTTHTFPDVINKARSLTSDTFKFVKLLKNRIHRGYDLATWLFEAGFLRLKYACKLMSPISN